MGLFLCVKRKSRLGTYFLLLFDNYERNNEREKGTPSKIMPQTILKKAMQIHYRELDLLASYLLVKS